MSNLRGHCIRLYLCTGIYILKKIRNFTKTKIQNCETLPKLNISIYSKFGQHYRHDITMYDFIHVIQFLIPIWSWISKMMLENVTFFHLFQLFVWILKNLEKFLHIGKMFAKLCQNFTIFSIKSETMPTTWCELNNNIQIPAGLLFNFEIFWPKVKVHKHQISPS